MRKTLTNIVKKIVASIGIATALVAGGVAGSGCNMGIPIVNYESEGPVRRSNCFLNNGDEYVGEIYMIEDPMFGPDKRTPYGYGTEYNKNGKIVRQGYWNMGQPTNVDPLNGRRAR